MLDTLALVAPINYQGHDQRPEKTVNVMVSIFYEFRTRFNELEKTSAKYVHYLAYSNLKTLDLTDNLS